MTLTLAALRLSPVGRDLGVPPDAWLRATVVIAGVEHFVDLVAVTRDRTGHQRAACRELDAMLGLHHLACGADGEFAPVTVAGKPYVLFVTPSAA